MIDLARCADFTIGEIAVRPSSRELAGRAGPVVLEPKVMQVLVALAQAGGRVVPRDDLVEQCWNGRIVGDDAVNRIIGKLRRTAEGPAEGAFRIETVARTGHKLVVNGVAPAAEPVRRSVAPWLGVVAMAAAAALILIFTKLPRRQPAPGQATSAASAAMPPAATDLETRGLSAMFDNTPEQTAEGVGYLRQAVALAPRTGPVWGSLAMSYVLNLGWLPTAERAAGAARVRDAAAHGLALDPAEPRSAAALVSLMPTFGNWAGKAAALAAARRRVRPDEGPLSYQQVQFLIATGQTRAALARLEPLHKRSPLVPWIRAAQIDLLAATGQLDEADRAADDAGKIWPRDRLIWFTRFDLAAFHGHPEQALAMTADRANAPRATTAAEVAAAAKAAEALRSRDPAAVDALMRALNVEAAGGHAAAERAFRVAAALGRTEAAFGFARLLLTGRLPAQPRATLLPTIGLPADTDPPTAALFLPPAAILWRDPRFMRLATDVGLVGYWQHSTPPDLCAEPAMQATCGTAGLGPAARR